MHTNYTLDLEMKTILQDRDTLRYEFLDKIQLFTGEYSTTSLSRPTFILAVLKEN